MRQLFLAILLIWAAGMPAFGQTVVSPVQPAGPPTPAQMQATQKEEREAQLRKLAGDMGMPSLGEKLKPGEQDVADPDAVALPDVTQTIPTTAEPKKLSASLEILLLMSLLTLAPSILLMTTCFTRIVIVMSLLRQALAAAQLPPNQILIGLSLFMTFLVMGPTWSRVNSKAIVPYNEKKITQMEAFGIGVEELRKFMRDQIESARNQDDVYMFYAYAHPGAPEPHDWGQIETTTLVPAYILSELKVAFLMGFRIYLPFLIIDMVISSVLISIGMQLLPPVMVSLPFKLLLFVLVDGWHLVCGTLLASFATG